MQTEIEAKFLAVEHDAMRTRLQKLGATRHQPLRLTRRFHFDFPDHRLDVAGGWVRVRDEGDKVTLAYKQLNDRSIHGMQEVSLVVDKLEAACDFLQSIGLEQTSYQETKRESWVLDGVEIELDEWPWIAPFVEIEGHDETAVRSVAQQLGMAWETALYGSVEVAYQAQYEVTKEEINHWRSITFSPTPDWLEAKRKKI